MTHVGAAGRGAVGKDLQKGRGAVVRVRVQMHDLPSTGAQRNVWARDIDWQEDRCRAFMRAEHNGCMSESTRVSEAVSSLEPEGLGMVTVARDGDDIALPKAIRAVQRVLVCEEGIGVSCAVSADLEQVGTALIWGVLNVCSPSSR